MANAMLSEQVGRATELAQQMREEIGNVIVGQREVIEQLLIAFFAGGHVLLEGLPGLGKTLLAKAFAKTFEGEYRRVQFTPDITPPDITGSAVYDPQNQRYRLRHGPVFTHLLLADEFNHAPARTQAALLEAMQERQVTIEGKAVALPTPFMTIATQSPVELEGSFPALEAQLDRFLLKIKVDYPSEVEETAIIRQVATVQSSDALDVSRVDSLVKPSAIQGMQRIIAQLRVDDRIYAYAVRLVRQTRVWPGFSSGASPRGGMALIRTARVWAMFSGREYVLPEDIKTMILPCLRHRVVLAPEARIEGKTADSLLKEMMDSVEAPRS